MKTKRFVFGLMLLYACYPGLAAGSGTLTPPATTGPQTLSGFGGAAGAHEFFLQSGSSWKGDLTGIGAGHAWSLVIIGVDASGVTGPADRYVYFNLQDADNGSHYKNLGISFRLDASGAGGGTLLQCYQQWTAEGQSSHGLNPGELTAGHFDLRFDFTKTDFADGWTLTPYFRLQGGVWTAFYDGPFTATVGGVDFNAGKLIVGFDGGADGVVSFDNYYLAGPPDKVYVDDDWTGLEDGAAVQFTGAGAYHTMGMDAFISIQTGIESVTGSAVHVADGIYQTPLNIDGRSGIAVIGQSQSGTIFKPASTKFWLIPGYPQYDSRRAAIRVVNSTDIEFQHLTMDFNLIKGNNVAGLLYWDATGRVNDNLIENMSVPDASGGYTEITSYFRAPGYNDVSRAQVYLTDNTFIRTGRVGIIGHDFVLMEVTGNTFDKGGADFGYAMEIGSAASALVAGNIIHGFNTPAASDNSASAGIYIENSFTMGLGGITKAVQLNNNEIYDCQNGLFIGNQVDDYAGDADITVTSVGNSIHNNTQTGVTVVDEDREHGSSVTVACQDNEVIGNGSNGYLIGSEGDGDITLDLTRETIIGNGGGIGLWDGQGQTSGSVYAINIFHSTIMGNTGYGVENGFAGTVITATHNYWGTVTGPHHGMMNPAGTGNDVSDYVDFIPWCNADFSYCEYPVICGDANGDGVANLADAVYLVNYIFVSGTPPDPLCIGDANGDGPVDLADAVYLINYVFKDGPPPVGDCCP